jgi:hypothetical protein
MDEPILAEGMNNNMPKLIMASERMSDFLYPIFLITSPDGPPNIRKAEKVAVSTKYDIPLLREKASSRIGTKIPLIPTPNPITKKAIPMMINGNKNLFLIDDMILIFYLIDSL